MPPALPASLSPHVVVLPSQDLVDLLERHGLPPIHQIFEAFSPVSQVTSRTTALVPVTHAHFPVRFSDLAQTEAACREDEEARASRTIDWIGSRIAAKAASWVDDLEKRKKGEPMKGDTKWWEELRRCVDGDRVPARGEGWSHPVAVILATTTLSPNPLQAITHLYSRTLDFPSWVDPNILRYTVIIHPAQLSNLSVDETSALFNATKKQYGLHAHLLTLNLIRPATPKPIAPLPPQLPPPSVHTRSPSTMHQSPNPGLDATTGGVQLDVLQLSDEDTALIGSFIREFVIMSLVPWMERCISEWNEAYTSTRRLPSRLFTTTRRLFGTSSSPSSSVISSVASTPTTPLSPTPGQSFNQLPQQRRLAEFVTVLGDYKLAVSLWESIRKEGKGGSEVLPMLLAPSLTLEAHAAYALSHLIADRNASASAQLRALRYAIRWEQGVHDLVQLGGERWLVWAAGTTEEPSMALLLAHGALISVRKGARRTAAMWYIFAANRLEKCGVKPLTVYFLRRAYELFTLPPEKMLSPSFEEVAGKRPAELCFDSILPHLEHSLGRLKYTTGDAEGAVEFFLGLLKGSKSDRGGSDVGDKLYLDDFRVALEHLRLTSDGSADLSHLKLPKPLSRPTLSRLRFTQQEDSLPGSESATVTDMESFEENWETFWKSRGGKEGIKKSGKAVVGEPFFLDLVMENPLGTQVTLSDLYLTVREHGGEQVSVEDVDISKFEEVILDAKEVKTISFTIVASRAVSLEITHLNFSFLSLLPTSEGLSVRGKRLNDTPTQRQGVVYGPDVFMHINVQQSGGRLDVETEGLESLEGFGSSLAVGEWRSFKLKLRNSGLSDIGDLWMVTGNLERHGSLWIKGDNPIESFPTSISSSNTISTPDPVRIDIGSHHEGPILKQGQSMEVPVMVHAFALTDFELAALFVFREDESASNFYVASLRCPIEVQPVIEVNASVHPSASQVDSGFILRLEVENVLGNDEVKISQLTNLSPCWSLHPLGPEGAFLPDDPISGNQIALILARYRLEKGCLPDAMRSTHFLKKQLSCVLEGRPIQRDAPPQMKLLASHLLPSDHENQTDAAMFEHFHHSVTRKEMAHSLVTQFTHIPTRDHAFIFPLYTHQTSNLAVFWEIPSTQRSGCVMVNDLILGASHGVLNSVLEQADSRGTKVRSMYAETDRERTLILDSVRNSIWNKEEDPGSVVVSLPERVEHDFASKGPLLLGVTFTIHNQSATCDFSFTLSFPESVSTTSMHLSPQYCGIRSHRGTVEAMSFYSVVVKLWIVQPGVYSIGGWRLRTEIPEEGVPPTIFQQSAVRGNLLTVQQRI